MTLSTREQALKNDLIQIEAAYQAQSEELARYVGANPKMEYSQAVLFTRCSLGHSLFYTVCLMQQFGTFSSAELDRVAKNLQLAKQDLEEAKATFATIANPNDAPTTGASLTGKKE